MRPSPPEILAHLAQALIYGGAAWELGQRWQGYAAALAGMAILQVLGAVAAGMGRRGAVRISALLTVVGVLALYGELLAQVWYLSRAFGTETGETVMQPLGFAVLLLPWVLFWPLSRLRGLPRPGAPLLVLGLLPALHGAGAPVQTGDPDEVRRLGLALWAQLQGGATATLPEGTLVTPLADGLPGKTLVVHGIVNLPSPGNRAALLVELPTDQPPQGLLRPGADAPPGISPWIYARSFRRREVLPGLAVPAAPQTIRYRSVLVSETGAVDLEDGWSAPPSASPEHLLAAVAAGAHHLMVNMQVDGRFTYIVLGNGRAGSGYNYPRHAGTSWFLARAAAALNDPAIGAAADRSLAHLAQVSGKTADGRAYILDPSRSDGKAWVGTTALALMALSLRHNNPTLAAAWLAQVAASVDAAGKVRGEMNLKSGQFPDQSANPYGQGQVMLALLAAERAGMTSGKPAMDRAESYMRGAYAGPHPLVVGDEHWMCLVAHALHAVRHSDAADATCAAYLAGERFGAPHPGAALQPQAGPAGGLGEAVAAWTHLSGASTDRAADYGWLFLRSQYRPEDAPLLPVPDRLIGGFRDGPGQLDVQIDAVQHIGSAMLEIAALQGGEESPGSWP